MTKRDKRIEAMRRNPRHVTPDDMDTALIGLGFARRSGRGDHRVYLHPDLPYPVVIDPYYPHLKRYQVAAALPQSTNFQKIEVPTPWL